MYTAGQIIDRKEHIAFANWNNANGGKLRSIPVGDGTYRLEEIPAPTTVEAFDSYNTICVSITSATEIKLATLAQTLVGISWNVAGMTA